MIRLSSQPLLPLLATLLACLAAPAYAQPEIQPQTGNGGAPPAASAPGSAVVPPTLNGNARPVPNGNASTAPATEAASPETTSPKAAPTLSDLGRSLRHYFTEEELSLLFQYMKESVIASFKDEEVFLPPDLSFKLEILLVRLKKESGHYMDNLINQLEKDLKNSLKEKLKEKLTPPPIKEEPYNPWITKPWE